MKGWLDILAFLLDLEGGQGFSSVEILVRCTHKLLDLLSIVE